MPEAIYKLPFGYITVQYEDKVLLSLICAQKEPEISSDNGVLSDFSNEVFRQIREYINGARTDFDINYRLSGTEFQLSVWRELLKIPYGETRTYREIAAAVGNSKAARAVGTSINKNPLHIIIPCHRVIGTDGSLTGYAGGLGIKEKLLDTERKNKK